MVTRHYFDLSSGTPCVLAVVCAVPEERSLRGALSRMVLMVLMVLM